MNLIEQAQMFATQKHVLDNGQCYGLLPYTNHLQDVERVLRRFGEDREFMLAAAWLHDVVEDTKGRPNEVKVRAVAMYVREHDDFKHGLAYSQAIEDRTLAAMWDELNGLIESSKSGNI